jgi:hypothetical protein
MKVDGSLGSLVQGVSQQTPAERRPGQHTEQINMLADPVRGLSRRHGTLWQTEQDLNLDSAKAAANLDDTKSFRSFDYTSGGIDYTLLYRSAAKAAGSDTPAVIVYDKTNKQFLGRTRNIADSLLDTLETGGISAVTAVGKYVFFSGNTIVPQGASTNLWSAAGNQNKTVLWVRGGAYSRTYKATVTRGDTTQVSFEYTTPTSSYPGTLDTSGISPYMPDPVGATTPTLAVEASASETDTPTPGSTHTLAFTPTRNLSVVLNYVISRWPPRTGTIVLTDGADFTRVGTTITWADTYNTRQITAGIGLGGVFNAVAITYLYAPGGTSVQTQYLTEVSTNEALYVASRDAVGVAKLSYGKWQPSGLTVKSGGNVLSNVYPASPANPNQYSWAAGSESLVLHNSLAQNRYVTATYTHIKLITNPTYTNTITDVTSEFNTAVTNWIGETAAAIQPEAIAARLKDAAIAAGLAGTTVSGNTVIFDNVIDITFNDGGDGTLLKGLANTVEDVADLTQSHFVGKVVKVSPGGDESFYMKAVPKNSSVVTGVTEVKWVEGAGISRTITGALCYGVVGAGSFHMAGSAALLNAILPGDHPSYLPATVGDDDTSPMPYFVGRTIRYLGVFQDRLLIGAGAVLRASKIGDYLNFFRSSVLTVPPNDPIEWLSQGSEDDTLRFSVLYDRDLILFGKRQYAVSGRVPLTPTSANMPVMSSHDGANDAHPRSAGGIIFYAKRGQNTTSVHQIEPGRNAESPESYPASSQLDDYMAGDPVELTVVPKPSTLLTRTSGARNSLFVFSYLDSSDRRQQDCWHRWDYHTALGPIIGTSIVREGVLVFSFRQALNAAAALKQWVVADLQIMDGQLSQHPYLDSLRTHAAVVSSPGSVHGASANFSAAFNNTSSYYLMGVATLGEVAGLLADLPATGLMVGMPVLAMWSPTNPVRHGEDNRPIGTGRLTVTKLLLSFRDSSGFVSTVTAFGSDTLFTFNGRIAGDVNNIIGEEPVTVGKQAVIVGRESAEYTQTLTARKWLPLNLTSVEWTGQLFHRPQRVS